MTIDLDKAKTYEIVLVAQMRVIVTFVIIIAFGVMVGLTVMNPTRWPPYIADAVLGEVLRRMCSFYFPGKE